MGSCPACGEPLADGAVFCGSCGTRLPEQPPAGVPYVSTASSDGPPAEPDPDPDPEPAPTPAPKPPPMPSFSHSELMNPTPAAAPAAPADRPRQVPVAAVAAVGVVVLAIATFLIVQLGESDSGGAGDEEALTVEDVGDALDAVTTPPATEQQYIDALLADSPDLGIGATPEQTTCFFHSMVVAVGGPDALRSQGVRPEDFARRDDFAGIDLPPDAPTTYLATASACGFDTTEVFIVSGFAISETPAEVDCVRAGIDRALADREVATHMFTGGSAASFTPSAALRGHLLDLAGACLTVP